MSEQTLVDSIPQNGMGVTDASFQKHVSEEKVRVKRKYTPRQTKKGTTNRQEHSSEPSDGGGHAPFPRSTFEDALVLGTCMQEMGAGERVRRSILFEKLQRSPESGPSRALVTTSSKYGITRGSYKSEFLELSEIGKQATNPETPLRAKKEAVCSLAILNVAPFKSLYETWKGKRVPSPEVMQDSLAEQEMSPSHRKECVELFMENAKFLGLLRTSDGSERLVTIEHLLDETQEPPNSYKTLQIESSPPHQSGGAARDWKKTCFFIAAIGDAGTEQRKHSDMVQSLIERALEREDIKVIRADGISDPGMIGGQIIEYLRKSALVVADLSFHNPNVFYELCFRHVLGLPTVHLIRTDDRVPFDVKDFRTIHINTADKYDLVAKLDTYRAEIANHARMALSAGTEGSNNPITSFSNLEFRPRVSNN